MKKKAIIPLIGLISSLIIIGCSSDKENQANHIEVPEVITVNINAPEQVDIHERVRLSTSVYQGEEAVDDAREVMFEVWKNEERESGELIEGEWTEDGLYEIDYTFESEGIYILQTHVTARDMHVMPKKMIIAGEVPNEDIEAFLNSGGPSNDTEESLHHH
ncbi:FixH family protein [Alkalihalobacillus oceani]|uniref:FixH family protein n=1 Tax=Halalkalibacter oceani TaxID=1653776 RepID=UPI002041E56D|nr:FixH family protein [Halalkalibacter oceani]MCM3759189.1 FixH family protein [Halalkalibacter oceani]